MVLPAGVTWVANIKGDRGLTGTFAGVTVESIAAGAPAEASTSGPEDAKVLHLKIPRGLPGVNAVPADEAVAAFIAGLDTDTRDAFNTATGWVSVPSAAVAQAVPVGASVDMLLLRGRDEDGDFGASKYVRVAAEPAHAGKIQTQDGAWWELAEPVLRPEMFGAFPLDIHETDIAVAEAADITDAWNRMSYAAWLLGRNVAISDGRWAHSGTLFWYDGVTYRGDSSADTWRTVNTSNDASFPNVKFENLKGAVFVAIGTFARSYTLKGITKGSQNGYGRNVYTVDRPYGNGLDSRMDMLDLTNQDAVGATPATLRPFSVAHHFVGDSQRRHRIEDVTFVPNCPKIGETFGLGGYGLRNEIPEWADVDFGVYAPTPFSGYFRFQAVGYWNDRGLLLTGHKHTNANIGYTENNVFDKCAIQSGVSIRMADSYPVKAKTATTVTLRWSPSHTFNPTGFLFIGQSIWSFTSLQYTSVTYSAANDGELIFTIPGGTSSVTVGGDSPDHAWLGLGAGFPLTVFRDSEIFDFSHASGLYDMAPELGSRAHAWRPAVEISGGTISNVRFFNTAIRPLGPMPFLFGSPKNIQVTDCWVEGRGSRRLATSDTALQPTGMVIIGGPTPALQAEVGEVGNGSIYFGMMRSLHVHVGFQPYYSSPSQYAFSGMENSITLIVRDDGKSKGIRDTSDERIWTLKRSQFDYRVRLDDNSTRRVLTGYSTGAVGLGESFTDNHAIYLPDRYDANPQIRMNRTVIPGGTDNTQALGSSSKRWTQLFAASGTINTSDERDKTDIRSLTEAEHSVAVALKSLVRMYRWKSSVDEKGDEARVHSGVIAQDVVKAFEDNGLDAMQYGIVCWDEWDEVPDEFDKDGSVVAAGSPAGERFGVRYDELLAFIIAAL